MANILVTIATNVGQYLAEPAIREVKYFLCVNNVIDDLENEKETLASERDNLLTRVAEAEERAEVIEKPVEKWLNDVENLLGDVEVLEERMEREKNCFHGWFPTYGRYLLCKQMVEKIVAMQKLKGKSNDIQPFSHRAPLPGIPYQSSEDFIYFVSRQNAYDELFEALNDDSTHMIGLYGEGGSGKTTLVTNMGNKVDKLNMFDNVISFNVSRTPNIRDIQGEIAEMLNLQLSRDTERGRAQCLFECFEKKKRILVILDGLWREFNLMDIGIHLSSSNKGAWKIIVTTRTQHVCNLMDCQKKIHLEILNEDESWALFQKHAKVDDEFSDLMDGVPRGLCNECKGLPITIKTVALSIKGKQKPEWELASANLRDSSVAFDDREGRVRHAMNCLKLSYDYLPSPEAQQLFLLCPLYPEDYHIPTNDLKMYAFGLRMGERLLLQSSMSLIQTDINKLLESGLLMRGCVKMHDMVRDTALWIADRSDNNKILVNVDKPLSIVANDSRIRDCFAVSSWWYNENPSFCQLHAPNLKMLLVNISAHSSLNSLDLSHLTFKGIQGLQVFSLTINYKIVPISFPSSTNLLTNVRTLRLNGLKFVDILFIANLTRLEVLDLRRCDFNELPIEIGKLESLKLLDLSECHIFENKYNGAIGKCSQLEELYASACYPEEYVYEITLDIRILPNLQRFVLDDQTILKSTRFLQLNDFNISKLRASKKIIWQIAKTISFRGLHGGCKNIIPDMVGAVGGMNHLSTLCFVDCAEIECILDTNFESKVDDWIPVLVELRFQLMINLIDLCQGPTLQVLPFFEKLEILDLKYCPQLHNIFPMECKLQNLKIMSLSYCKSSEVLFPISVAQSLLQLEKLIIEGCDELRHIMASNREHGFNTSKEISQEPMDSHFLMPCLRDVKIYDCQKLESIFPLCYVGGLSRLQMIDIWNVPQLKYLFGECDHQHQFQNHIMLPNLENLKLCYLHNLIGISPEFCQAKWPSESLKTLTVRHCAKLPTSWIAMMAGSDQTQHHRNENKPSKLQELVLRGLHQLNSVSCVDHSPRQIWSVQCLQYLQLNNCENLKYLFSMEVQRSLPELMSICIYNCQELEQIIAADDELVQLPNAEVYFPKLKHIEVENCNKLKSLFPFSMVIMLPQLSTLRLSKASQLQEVFRHSRGNDIINNMEIVLPNLTVITLCDLPDFVDICHGCKFHAAKLLDLIIYNCPKSAPSLRQIQDETERAESEMTKILSEKSKRR